MATLSLKYDALVKKIQYQNLSQISQSASGYVPFSQQPAYGVANLMLRQQAAILGVDITPNRSQTPSQASAYANRVIGVAETLGGTQNLLETAQATSAFGPQYRRVAGYGLLTEFRLPTLQRPTERNVFGETIAPGTFISGPGIKKLDIAGLRQAGALSAAYITSEPMAMATQDRVPLGDIGGLTFSQRQGLADVQTQALAPTVGIASPLAAYTAPSPRIPDVTISRYQETTPIEGPSAAFSSAASDYYSYISRLPELAAESARATASSLTSKRLRETGVGAGLSTGDFGVDVAADIATIPFRQEVSLQRYTSTNITARNQNLGRLISEAFDTAQEFRFPLDPLQLNVPRLPDYSVSRLAAGASSISTRTYSLPSNLNLPRLLPR